MEKKYQELFDQVHASPALRMEVLHMKERERTGRRRMPAAALIAALLVAVLAGTALAAGAMGLVHADFMDLGILTNGEHREGLLARGEVAPRPLSERALERVTGKEDTWIFDSLEEAEDFLGLEIASNDVLDQMEAIPSTVCRSSSAETITGGCLVDVTADPLGGQWVPRTLRIFSAYMGEHGAFFQSAEVKAAHPNRWREEDDPALAMPTPDGGLEVEDYVTPRGLEVKIVKKSYTHLGGVPGDYCSYDAFFVLNNTFFDLYTSAGQGEQFYFKDAELALAEMKAILDGYR